MIGVVKVQEFRLIFLIWEVHCQGDAVVFRQIGDDPVHEPEMIVRLSGVELGMWRAAAQVVEREENGETGGPVPAFLLAKSSSCPFSLSQKRRSCPLRTRSS